jgi:hypothetical protein
MAIWTQQEMDRMSPEMKDLAQVVERDRWRMFGHGILVGMTLGGVLVCSVIILVSIRW